MRDFDRRIYIVKEMSIISDSTDLNSFTNVSIRELRNLLQNNSPDDKVVKPKTFENEDFVSPSVFDELMMCRLFHRDLYNIGSGKVVNQNLKMYSAVKSKSSFEDKYEVIYDKAANANSIPNMFDVNIYSPSYAKIVSNKHDNEPIDHILIPHYTKPEELATGNTFTDVLHSIQNSEYVYTHSKLEFRRYDLCKVPKNRNSNYFKYRQVCDLLGSGPFTIYTGAFEIENKRNPKIFRNSGVRIVTLDTVPNGTQIYSNMRNNNQVNVAPNVEIDSIPLEQILADRRITSNHLGFFDPGYSVASQDAGSRRMVTAFIKATVCNNSLIHLCHYFIKKLSLLYDYSPTYCVTCHFYGHIMYSTPDLCNRMFIEYINYRGYNKPVIHYFPESRLLVISVGTGILMRPIDNTAYIDLFYNPNDLIWLDSINYHSSYVRRLLGEKQFASRSILNNFCVTTHTYPYTLFDTSPRPLVASSMMSQSVCLPYVEMYSTVWPSSHTVPHVVTPLTQVMNDILKSDIESRGLTSTTNQHGVFSGATVFALFANFMDTYEDSIIVSDSLNNIDSMLAYSYILHPVPVHEDELSVGDVIDNKKYKWWRLSDKGVVIEKIYNEYKKRFVKCKLYNAQITIGDKIATTHGQKWTVSKVIPYKQMPLCVDTDTNMTFRPNVIISSTSIHNRATHGQIFETQCNPNCIITETGHVKVIGEPYVTTLDGADCYNFKHMTCTFTRINKDNDLVLGADGKPAEADYGPIVIHRLAHLVRDKQQYMSAPTKNVTSISGKLDGSSVKLGEMELHAIMANGLISCMDELLEATDQCNVKVCKICKRLIILCDCKDKTNRVAELVRVRYYVVILDICIFVINLSRAIDNNPDVKDTIRSLYHKVLGGRNIVDDDLEIDRMIEDVAELELDDYIATDNAHSTNSRHHRITSFKYL